MPAFAVLAFATRKARVYHYSLTVYDPDNVAAADVQKHDLFDGNANPCPYVKMVYSAVFDVNNNLTIDCNWIRDFAILQNIYRPMLKKWDGLHTIVCISFRSLPNCASSDGTVTLVGSFSESGLPSLIVSFFLFQTIELKSIICFVYFTISGSTFSSRNIGWM